MAAPGPAPARNLPILHVVYAGRGDSLYVEYQPAGLGQQSKLFVMDGGPRGFGEQANGEDGRRRPAKTDFLGTGGNTRPYWRMFFSAGKDIWFEQMARPVDGPFRLDAMLNSHLHEDHVEGMIDMITRIEPEFLELDTGFIIPALDKPQANNIKKLWTSICDDGTPGLTFPRRQNPADPITTWDRNLFRGGIIEYPPLRRNPVRVKATAPLSILPDTDDSPVDYVNVLEIPDFRDKPPLICLRRPEDIGGNPGPQALAKTDLVAQIQKIDKYVKAFRIETGKERNDPNLTSLLVHVPTVQGSENGGIYLTGDNNGNLIHYFMKRRQPNANVRRHFGIYKLQHHGGHHDAQYFEKTRQTRANSAVMGEIVLLMTFLAAEVGTGDVTDPVREEILGPRALELIDKEWRTKKRNVEVQRVIEGCELLIQQIKDKSPGVKVSLKPANKRAPMFRKLVNQLIIRYNDYKAKAILGETLQYKGVVSDPDDATVALVDPSAVWEGLLKQVQTWGGQDIEQRKAFWQPKSDTAARSRTRKGDMNATLAWKMDTQAYLYGEKPQKKEKKDETAAPVINPAPGNNGTGNNDGIDEEDDDDEADPNEDSDSDPAPVTTSRAALKAQSKAAVSTKTDAIEFGDPEKWWQEWWRGKKADSRTGIWFEQMDGYTRLNNIKAFFHSFTADAYVASANHRKYTAVFRYLVFSVLTKPCV